MFGRLTIDSIPWSHPIPLAAFGFIILVVLAVLTTITVTRRWGWLWTNWLTTTDHKRIGIIYIIVAIVMLLRGFSDAIMMRTQMALASTGDRVGYLPPEHYDQIFSAHGVIMIFFMAMPFIIGLMNIIIPQQLGRRDVAFPVLNAVSVWLTVAGAILINLSLGIGEFAKTGWVAYAPLSESLYSPGVGVDYYMWSIQISGLGTTFAAINMFVTILRMRAPGMKMFQMPLFSWSTFCTSILILATFPILTATMLLLALDRYLGFEIFTNTLGGGSQMMYVNLIWAWGHPEVYILILPVFGIFSEVVSTFSRKYLFGYKALVWAIIAILFMSLTVWLHHFFTMGAGVNVNAFFGITTMLIAIPTGVKVFNWLFTIYRGQVRMEPPMLWAVGFLVLFVLGGMTGVMLAIPGVNYSVHNTMFVVAHFHNTIIGGVVFGVMAGYNYWFPKAFGFKLNKGWGVASFYLWFFGFLFAFVPLYLVGFDGMPRRVSQNIDYRYGPYLVVAFFGAVMILFGIITMLIQLFVSIKHREQLRDETGDPWNGRTLEWSIPSPPPAYNFAVIPEVNDIDMFWKLKQEGKAYDPHRTYEDIYVPKHTALGFVSGGVLAGLTAFCLVWSIWWLGIIFFGAAIIFWIVESFREHEEVRIPKENIAAADQAFLQHVQQYQLAQGGRS
ncbi:cytochrome o ubiquinol oxidase subunit I [Wohlfahrtiimonas chitiniclastica]|uniref:cbb3-type cytochrome c oxidase subunit I n=1 Tax=Wohlfahrtiimonas chitiniclastica TaxID=400946 RepID=UPI000B982409|nr:cbb3-type cytochrome c oxidase subunit I [Wohlfahrtiimonas chitiniclastica]OYQ69503.1 cytochrome o ubiquinol oxidase subunit I [Wohlfahrtiimonas chitiniclastica]OYQ80911.1 cytochrome o ubiquinol oxidase subunit I [Wohlfahrtiimonas chitiniclastica]OYQ85667.1 cytochrome o ubiquinol oxidase subunit I [Wohlfahrtiimonas chitiniclastica]OYQ86097.1 cytochrome o ubiquinol oxidase subunit I [Wohlfahrtiimonas chitiniclastica]